MSMQKQYTPQQAEKIRQMKEDGHSWDEIQRRFGMSKSQVQKILHEQKKAEVAE